MRKGAYSADSADSADSAFSAGSSFSAGAAALAARNRKVTIWPRVQVLSGEKVVSLVPEVIF